MEFLVAVFTVGSVFGYLAETLWCLGIHHVLESRQGMVFGPFSQVYGIGAVILTLIISKNSSSTGTFLISAVVGGVYEYLCSYIQEKVFGTVSWDYGDGLLSIGGRTHLLFCLFWGLMGILLIRYVNPALSSFLSRVPAASVSAAVLAVFFVLNMQLSYMAVKRQSGRRLDLPAATAVEEWLDLRFNDDVLKKIYPNMRVVGVVERKRKGNRNEKE